MDRVPLFAMGSTVCRLAALFVYKPTAFVSQG